MDLPQDVLDQIEERVARYRTMLTDAAIKRCKKQQERKRPVRPKPSLTKVIEELRSIADGGKIIASARRLDRSSSWLDHFISGYLYHLGGRDGAKRGATTKEQAREIVRLLDEGTHSEFEHSGVIPD